MKEAKYSLFKYQNFKEKRFGFHLNIWFDLEFKFANNPAKSFNADELKARLVRILGKSWKKLAAQVLILA